MTNLVEEERRLLGLVLPRVENVVRLMASEGVENPAETFRLLQGLDPEHPPTIEVAKYLPHMIALRALFRYGGNDLEVEVALVRAADIMTGLL
jgi:hypothetical protein